MRHKCIAVAVALACQLSVTNIACAAEKITYSYDAKGRLTKVVSANDLTNIISDYAFDLAGNRKTTNISILPSVQGIIVVPLNGLTPIFIQPTGF